MTDTLDKVKNALTRKVGPLPAWAWLAIFAGAVIIYRARTAKPGDQTTGEVVDSTAGGQDPVTLGPGESVYDPNTGQMVGGGGIPTDPQAAITLEPGEAAYDPNTGQLITNPVPPDTPIDESTANKADAHPKKTSKGPSTRHLLDELRHPGNYSPSHLAHVRRLLRSRHVKIPRRKHKTPKKSTHPNNARDHKHKPQHSPPAHHGATKHRPRHNAVHHPHPRPKPHHKPPPKPVAHKRRHKK